MSPETASLTGVALGAFLTGGVTIIVTLVTVNAERKQQHAKQALEGLLSVHDALTEMSAFYGRFTTQALTSLTSRELKPIDSLHASQAFSRLSYHLGIYAPELLPDFTRLSKSSEEFMHQWVDSCLAAARGHQEPQLVLSLAGKMMDQVKAITEFQSKLAAHARGKYLTN